jgi:hypothetical protein
MFEQPTRKCLFVKLGNGSTHAEGGPLGRYKITKLTRDRGFQILWYPGATGGTKQSYWTPTLTEAKRLVAYRLHCKMPKSRKRK